MCEIENLVKEIESHDYDCTVYNETQDMEKLNHMMFSYYFSNIFKFFKKELNNEQYW